MLQIFINYKQEKSEVVIPIDEWQRYRIGELKSFMADWYNLTGALSASSQRIWIVFKGKELMDDTLVKDSGVENGVTLFMGIRKVPPSSTKAAPSATSNEESLIGSLTNQLDTADFLRGSKSSEIMSPRTEFSQLAISSPTPSASSSRGMGDIFGKLIANNPEMFIEMMEANPRTKALLQKNPQMRHAMRDPKLMQEMMEMAMNPKAMQETMRGHDRALANIENLPGGFQALQQFMGDDMGLLGGESEELNLRQKDYETRRERRTDAMPNPWASQSRQSNGQPDFPFVPAGSNDHGSSRIFPPWMLPSSTATAASTTGSPIGEFDTTTYEDRFKDQLAALNDMGFNDLRANICALIATGGNVNAAIDRLLRK